jgi:hypothetical protein
VVEGGTVEFGLPGGVDGEASDYGEAVNLTSGKFHVHHYTFSSYPCISTKLLCDRIRID